MHWSCVSHALLIRLAPGPAMRDAPRKELRVPTGRPTQLQSLSTRASAACTLPRPYDSLLPFCADTPVPRAEKQQYSRGLGSSIGNLLSRSGARESVHASGDDRRSQSTVGRALGHACSSTHAADVPETEHQCLIPCMHLQQLSAPPEPETRRLALQWKPPPWSCCAIQGVTILL